MDPFSREGSLYPLDLFTSFVQQHPSGTGRGRFQNPGKWKMHPGFFLLLWQNLTALSSRRWQFMVLLLYEWCSFRTNEKDLWGGGLSLSHRSVRMVTLQWVNSLCPWWFCSFPALGSQGSSTERDICLKGVYVVQWNCFWGTRINYLNKPWQTFCVIKIGHFQDCFTPWTYVSFSFWIISWQKGRWRGLFWCLL